MCLFYSHLIEFYVSKQSYRTLGLTDSGVVNQIQSKRNKTFVRRCYETIEVRRTVQIYCCRYIYLFVSYIGTFKSVVSVVDQLWQHCLAAWEAEIWQQCSTADSSRRSRDVTLFVNARNARTCVCAYVFVPSTH